MGAKSILFLPGNSEPLQSVLESETEEISRQERLNYFLNMKNARHSYCKEIPLWKWTLLFIGGTILFLMLYICAQTAIMAEVEGLLKICISLAAATPLIAAYIILVGKMERRRTDELILPSAIAWTGKGLLIGIGFFSIVTAILALSGMYSIDGTDVNFVKLIECFTSFLVVAVGET